MKQSLRTKLTSSILIIVLIAISGISFLSNYFINRQFTEYMTKQQELKIQIMQSSIGQQYVPEANAWDMDYIQAIGTLSLYEGYIVKIYDKDKNILWDAHAHDMELCHRIMDDISVRMQIRYPNIATEFTTSDYTLMQNNEIVGSVSIGYFGPFFVNENESNFLTAIQTISLSIGSIALILSLIVGSMMARRISKPILKTVAAAKQIADGSYDVRLDEVSDTKELDMLVNSINDLAISLEKMEKLRRQLTQDVAHELRTPIAILQSYIEAMAEGIWDATPERLESCHEEIIRISKLVGDLENLAKLEVDNLKLDKKQIDLCQMIQKTIAGMQGELQSRHLEIEVLGTHAVLQADDNRLRQVIVNLLSNAIKYSQKDCRITFEVFEDENNAGFTISDNGMGISEEELPFIFERFYRADKSRNRATGGSGIGLTIVKSIVHAHDGQIFVESVLGEGTKFTVILPKA